MATENTPTPPPEQTITTPPQPVTAPSENVIVPAGETELIPLHELSPSDLAKAKETQEFPRREKKPKAEKPAVEAKAPKTSDPADPAAEAVSEPPAEKPPKARSAKDRAAELKAENDELEAQLRRRDDLVRERSRRDMGPRDPAKTPTAEERKAARMAEWKKLKDHPDAPQVADFEAIEDYTAAMSDFVSDYKLQMRDARQQAESRARSEHDEFIGAAQQSVAAFQEYFKTRPDELQRIAPQLMQIVPITAMRPEDGAATMENYLAERIARSPVPGQLMVYFSSPEGRKHWRALNRMAIPQVLEEFGALTYQFRSPSGGSPVADPPPREVSQAPDPPKHVVSRTTGTIDQMQQAVHVGDVTALRQAMLAEDQARSGR